MPKGKVIVKAAHKRVAQEPTATSDPPLAENKSAASLRRRRIYIKERLPTILAEMKSLSDEKKRLMARRNEAQPEKRKQVNWRLNFLAERLAVLRDERAALIEESRRYARATEERD